MRAAIAAESKAEEEKAQKAKEASAWIAHKAADGQVSLALTSCEMVKCVSFLGALLALEWPIVDPCKMVVRVN